MRFAHERLDVYQLSLEFLVLAGDIGGGLPRGRGYVVDQLNRAALSVVLNIAEGAGKISRADKRRYYVSAAASANECAAILDACLQLRVLPREQHADGKKQLDRIAAMLVGLSKSLAD